jgi:hypothetical protein
VKSEGLGKLEVGVGGGSNGVPAGRYQKKERRKEEISYDVKAVCTLFLFPYERNV